MNTLISPSSSRSKIPPFEDFLKNISPESPTGPSLRYDVLYDDIRQARQEDDPQLSMGIWETELKRADWPKIENLCLESLLKTSKDLQIAAWLTEAWTGLDGITGYIRGVNLMTALCQTFWATMHPQIPEDGDIENRYMILEWFEKTLVLRLLLVPLTQSKFDQSAFGLGFFKSAQYTDATKKRLTNTAVAATKQKLSQPSKTVEDFQKSLDQTPDIFLTALQGHIKEAWEATQSFKSTLTPLLESSTPSFSRLLETFKEMERPLHTTLQNRQPPLEVEVPESASPDPDFEPATRVQIPSPPLASSKEGTFKNRTDAYRQLDLIATFLEKNDPHSLAPQLIRQLIRWENKNIMDIFEEITKSPQEVDILMKILGGPSREK